MPNRRNLTPRERMVAKLVEQGRSNPEIAQTLGISLSTAKQNLANVMIKWNCANRTQVAVEATRRLPAESGADEVLPESYSAGAG